MQIAVEVRRVLNKKPNSIKLKDMLIEWVTPKKKPTKEEKKGIIQTAKSMWEGLTGVTQKGKKIKITYKTKPLSSIDPELRKHLNK